MVELPPESKDGDAVPSQSEEEDALPSQSEEGDAVPSQSEEGDALSSQTAQILNDLLHHRDVIVVPFTKDENR